MGGGSRTRWPGAKGQLLFAYLVLNRFRRIGRDELLDAVYGEEATARPPPPAQRALVEAPPRRGRRAAGRAIADRASCCRPTPSSTSKPRSTGCTGPSRTSRTANGRKPGAPPESPTTWPAGPCSRATTARGWTSGGDASTTFACAGSSASRRPGSASADRRCRRPRSAARQLIALAPYRETGYRILMEALAQRGNVAEALLVYDRLRVLLREELGIAPSPSRPERPPAPAGRDGQDDV